MENLRTVLIIVLIAVCAIGIIVILMQEGKQAGLSALSGSVDDNYWTKNKGRTMESRMVKFTAALVAVYMGVSVVLNMNFIQ